MIEWKQVDRGPLPAGIDELTKETLGLFAEGQLCCTVGVMRYSLLGLPVLWMVPAERRDFGLLRLIREATDALHEVLGEPILTAEVRENFKCNRRFIEFCGFQPVLLDGEAGLFRRIKT